MALIKFSDYELKSAFSASILMVVFLILVLVWKWIAIMLLILFLGVAGYTGYVLFYKKKDVNKLSDVLK